MVPAWYLHDTQALILSGLHVHEPGTERAIRCFFMIGRELRAGEAALVALHAGERLGCIDRGRRPVESSCQRSMAAPVVAPPKPWRAEYKKSPELVVCRTCAIPIAGDSFCVINLVLAYKTCLSTEHGIQFLPLDGYVANWHHATCILQMKKRIREYKHGRVTFVDNRKILNWSDVEGAEMLLWRDGEKLRKYIEEEDMVGEYEVEKAENSRSACKSCERGFRDDQVMICHTEPVGGGRFHLSLNPQWRHANCFFGEFPDAKVPGLACPLPSQSQAAVRALTSSSFRVSAPGIGATQWKAEEKREETAKAHAGSVTAKPQYGVLPPWIPLPTIPAGEVPPRPREQMVRQLFERELVKRRIEADRGKKRDGGTAETSGKRQKTSGSEADAAVAIGTKVVATEKDSVAAVKQVSVVTKPLSKFEQQSKDLLELKNDLREHVSIDELREVLIANDQDDAGSLDELLDRCADGMMFGALKGCPNCKSPMEFREESYKCRGIIADGFPCTFTTLKARRIDVNDYMIGEAYNNPYLIQWYTDHLSPTRKGPRLLAPKSPADPTSTGNPTSASNPTNAGNPTSAGDPTGAGYSTSDDDSSSADDSTSTDEVFLFRCMFVAIGKFSMTQAKLKNMVQAAGGTLRGGAQALQDLSFLFCSGPVRAIITTEKTLDNDKLLDEIDFARTKAEWAGSGSMPIVKEQFLLNCLKKKKILPVDGYTLQLPRSTRWTEKLKPA